MALRYCFEEDRVKATLARSKPSDLAVIDSDGISKAVIQQSVRRGVMVYAYDSRLEAESKYHAVLAAAAISALPMHTCDLIQADGVLLARQCYVHEQTEELTE